VLLGFQVDALDEGCSIAVEFANVPQWLNVILDLNRIQCSFVQKSRVAR
jgi:hypothetical protein